jgi:hypothetical protein
MKIQHIMVHFLPWLLKHNVGLAQLALKMHAISASVNGVLKLSFSKSIPEIIF